MNYTYKIYYSVLTDVPANQQKDRDMIITAPNPIRAIDVFHRNIQTMKPKLSPTDYKVTALVQRYKDTPVNQGGTGAWLESAVDLPSSPNPEIGHQPSPAHAEQTEMPLNDPRIAPEVRYEQAEKQAV